MCYEPLKKEKEIKERKKNPDDQDEGDYVVYGVSPANLVCFVTLFELMSAAFVSWISPAATLH